MMIWGKIIPGREALLNASVLKQEQICNVEGTKMAVELNYSEPGIRDLVKTRYFQPCRPWQKSLDFILSAIDFHQDLF